MPREARVLVENACYHIITRGNQKQKVFLETDDYETYLELLTRYKKRYYFKLYGYCMMINHTHLIIDPRHPKELSRIMHGLNLTYAAYFNKKYEKIGHLWQDRFKSMIIEKDKYLLTCINYVELNPVRAELFDDPLRYRWSSYRARTIGEANSLLDIPKI